MRCFKKFLGVLVFLLLSPGISQAYWEYSKLPIPGGYSWSSDDGHLRVAVDSSDYPHLLLHNGSLLCHYYFDGQVWVNEVIDREASGSDGAIAIDSQGHVHVVYRTRTMLSGVADYQLMYAYSAGTGWTKSRIEDRAGWGISLFIDSRDRLHVAYVTQDVLLKYSKFNGTSWITTLVPITAPLSSEDCSIAVRNGIVHIVAATATAKQPIVHASLAAGIWKTSQIGYGDNPSLAIDKYDRPHVVYQDRDGISPGLRIKYTTFENSAWTARIVPTATKGTGLIDRKLLGIPRIIVDADAHPNVFYSNSIGSTDATGLCYSAIMAHFDGTYWVKDLVDKNGKDHAYTLITALAASKMHVFYKQATLTGSYKFIWASTDDPTVVGVTATDPVASEAGSLPGQFVFMRTGRLNQPLDVYYSLSGKALNGADYQQLTGEITIPAGSSSEAIDVVPVNDKITEGAEGVVVTLKSDPAYAIGIPSKATVKIKDND